MMGMKPDRLIGQTIAGKYRIEAKIGQGGMGTVYRARNVVTGKVVAIKVLLEDMAAYPSFVERFLHEARAAAYLTHPHAINIIDCGREGDVVYLLMEYLEGRTLTELMKQEGPLPPERAASILSQVCAALADAHSQSIIHRDLKPDNIILQQVAGQQDYVKVLDFGIAKVLDDQKRGDLPVSRSMFVGTPEYASPEQCNSKGPTTLSDVYSLGVILYEMLTGHTPFEGDPMEVMMKHVSAEPPPLRAYRPDLSREIEATVLRALKKNPGERPQSVLEFAEQFERAVSQTSGRRTGPVRRVNTGELTEKKGTTQQVRAAPTRAPIRIEVPLPPAATKPFRLTTARVVSLFVVVVLLAGGVSGYKLYQWYRRPAPSLPSPPPVKAEPAPKLALDPVREALKLFDEGNRDAAVERLRDLISKSEFGNAAAHNLLGFIHLDQGEIEGAINEFKVALEQGGGALPEAHLNLGQALVEQGDEDAALKEFLAAVERSDGRLVRAQVALGRHYQRQGRADKAENAFSAAIRFASDSAEDVLEVGKVLLFRKQYELAVRELRQAINLKTGFFPEAYLTLGLTLWESGDVNNAAEVLNTAVSQRAGNYPAARYALGLAHYRRGETAKAIDALTDAIRLRGGFYPEAQLALAEVHADLAVGDYEAAEKGLQTAIRNRNGRFAEAERALGLLYFVRLGRWEDAKKALTTAGGKETGDLLEKTKDAVGLQARATAAQKVIRPELKTGSRLTFDFSLTPLVSRPERVTTTPAQGRPRANESVMTFKLGDSGVGVRIERKSDKPGVSVRAFRIAGSKEEPIEKAPFGSGLMEDYAATLSISVERNAVVLTLNGDEVGRLRNYQGSPLVVTTSNGRTVLFNFRETSEGN
jgi:serine/threonine-protein kinase